MHWRPKGLDLQRAMAAGETGQLVLPQAKGRVYGEDSLGFGTRNLRIDALGLRLSAGFGGTGLLHTQAWWDLSSLYQSAT